MTTNQPPWGCIAAAKYGPWRAKVITAIRADADTTCVDLANVLVFPGGVGRPHEAGTVRLTAAELDALIEALIWQRTARTEAPA